MTNQTFIVGGDRQTMLGGTFVKSKAMPQTEYWFAEAGDARVARIGKMDLVSIERGGGAFVLDPENGRYCCLAQHHYSICRLPDDCVLVLLNREVLQTNLKIVRIWTVEIGDWLEFENAHLGLDEAALRALWESVKARPPSEEHWLQFMRFAHPL